MATLNKFLILAFYLFLQINLCGQGTINGFLFYNDGDCINGLELPTGTGDNWKVKFENGTDVFYDGVDLNDPFYSKDLEPGVYQVSLIAPNKFWETCPAVEIEIVSTETISQNLGANVIGNCILSEVNVVVPNLRKCFLNNARIDFANRGTRPMEGATIKIQLDEYTEIQNSSMPLTNLGDNLIEFEIGDVDPFENGFIDIEVFIDCDAPLGLTHCLEATILPNEYCEDIDPEWDGSSIVVESTQVGNVIQFTITNLGADMTGEGTWIIIEDDLLMREEQFQLTLASNNNSITVDVPCRDKTYRMEATQSLGHPGISMPSSTVQGCDGLSSVGFVTLYDTDDQNLFEDHECIQNVDEFDSNDKQGLPFGITDDHCISPGSPIEYLIRFQNTSGALVNNVQIRDSLVEWLNIETLTIVAASHDYEYSISSENTIGFSFNNIALPDKSANESDSHGFVKFKVFPKPNTPIGTRIENTAFIYYDLNDPVATNVSFHTYDDECMGVVSSILKANNAHTEIKVIPNPFNNNFVIKAPNNKYKHMEILIFHSNGQLFDTQKSAIGEIRYSNEQMPTGMFYYELYGDGTQIAVGKLINTNATK